MGCIEIEPAAGVVRRELVNVTRRVVSVLVDYAINFVVILLASHRNDKVHADGLHNLIIRSCRNERIHRWNRLSMTLLQAHSMDC